MLSAAALAALVIGTPVLARQDAPRVAAQAACEHPGDAAALKTDQQLLDALRKRRAEVAQTGTPDTRREALAFLDNRIAAMRARVAACIPAG